MHHPASSRQVLIIFAITGLYLLTAGIAAWRLGNSEFVFYIVVMLIIIAGITLLHRRVGLSAGLLSGLCLWGFLHMAGGLVPIPASWHQGLDQDVLYNFWFIPQRLKYDQVVHALGFGLTTWLCWQALETAFEKHASTSGAPRPTLGLMVLCGAAGMGFGALNEVVEFIATLTLPNTNVGGYENTGWDLVSNLVGAIIAAVLIWIRGRTQDTGRG